MQSRIKSAIEFLKDNKSFLVGNLRLGINATDAVQVTGWSLYTDFKNLNQKVCLEELNEVKGIFSDMLVSSEELRRFVKDRTIEYCLDFDDYGKSSIGICSEKNGHINWYIDLK